MKIKKIYIKNFKWVKEKHIIDFNKNITFLAWPNWFWKTTIFDSIELCLTWKLHRVIKNQDVTKDNKNYKKPFFQNTESEDVIIKLLIEKDDDQKSNFIIVKYFDSKIQKESIDNKKWTKKYKVKDINKDFKTYTESLEKFWLDTFSSSDATILTESEISNFFELRENESIEKIFPLYNYLQQEETTYFLKKREEERKNDFNFLFKTEDEANLKDKIKNFNDNINLIYSELSKKYELKKKKFDRKKWNIKIESEIEYTRFFDKDLPLTFETVFDVKDVFKKTDLTDLEDLKEEYNKNINNLRFFLNSFNIEEYKKYEYKNKLNEIKESYFPVEKFVLQNFLQDDKYLEFEKMNTIYDFSKSEVYIDYLVLEKYLWNDNKALNVKNKSLLYDLTSENDNLFKYFVVEKLLKESTILTEWEKKYELKKILWNPDIIDSFLLGDFTNDYYSIQKQYNNYLDITKNDKIIDLLLLKKFYEKSNWKSKYEIISEINNNVNSLKKFKLLTSLDDKISSIFNIYNILWLNNIDLLDKLKNLIKRKNELENDLWENDKTILTFNDIRSSLIKIYSRDIKWKIWLFDNKCLLCWSKNVWEIDINNFNIFEDLVSKRTEEICKITLAKNNELELVKNDINKIISDLLIYIDEYIDKNKELLTLYNKLNWLITIEFYEDNIELLTSLFDEWLNEYIYNANELKFSEYDIKKSKLLKIVLDKNIYWFKLFRYIEKLKNFDNKLISFDVLVDLLELNTFDYKIDISLFSPEKYIKLKEDIIDIIKSYINDFNFELYDYLKNISNLNIDSKELNKVKNFLWSKINDYQYQNNDNLSVSNIDKFKNNLKSYIIETTFSYKLLFLKLNELRNSSDNINKEIISNLKDFYFDNNIDFNYIDWENINIFLKNLYENIRVKTIKLLKDKVDFFKELRQIKWNNSVDNLTFLNSLNIETLRDNILDSYVPYKGLNIRYKKVKKIISFESENIEIDNDNLWWDFKDLFNNIFKWDINLVKKYKEKISLLDLKQKYIWYKFYEISNNQLLKEELLLWKIFNRLEKLKNIKKNSTSLKNIYENWIKNYIGSMIKKIEVPFFIYTAKIIQNYQQWIWIFIVFEWKKSIRFLSDWESNHDAIHHLSSWQLAVTSIAFTLAVNKAFNISKYLKFINIDDPIQEMDSLNIHSFIELLRHSFLNYNLLMSTHNDENAYFMKYKIERLLWDDTVELINVQNKFFKPTINT